MEVTSTLIFDDLWWLLDVVSCEFSFGFSDWDGYTHPEIFGHAYSSILRPDAVNSRLGGLQEVIVSTCWHVPQAVFGRFDPLLLEPARSEEGNPCERGHRMGDVQ